MRLQAKSSYSHIFLTYNRILKTWLQNFFFFFGSVLSSIVCGFSKCSTRNCVLVSLGLFRLILGLGIGVDYPLSATIMWELANKRTNGPFIPAMFSTQGFKILAALAVTIVVCAIFDRESDGAPKDPTPKETDLHGR